MPFEPFIQPIVILLMSAFWVYCLVDALRQQRSWIWIATLAFLPILSAFFYYWNFKALGATSQGRIDAWLGDSTRLRELERQAAELDVPGVHRDIADVYFCRGEYAMALEKLKHVLDLDGDDLRSQYQAGVCLTALGKPEMAIPHIEYVLDQDERYGFGEAHLALANALMGVSEDERAFENYQHVVDYYNVPEAVVRYARILVERGERDTAMAALRTMLSKVALLPPDDLPRYRPWIRQAAEELRTLEKS